MVFVLQLLPVKQAVSYFCFNNSITEEIIDINESAAKKLNIADEDYHFLNDHLYLLHPSKPFNNRAFGLYIAMLPTTYTDDIETPPPNIVLA